MPGNADGSLDGIALKPLTVAFHEPGFIATLQAENQQPFWFMMSSEQRQKAGNPMGPANPQALNRYSYVLNSPLKWTDPSGHVIEKGGNKDVGFETVCHVNGVEANCSQPGAVELTHDGKTVVRTYVRNRDGTYTYKDLLQGSAELDIFKGQVERVEVADTELVNAGILFGGTAGTAAVTCGVAGPGTAGITCGIGIVVVVITGGGLLWSTQKYLDARYNAQGSFNSLPGAPRTRRCRESGTSVSCVG